MVRQVKYDILSNQGLHMPAKNNLSSSGNIFTLQIYFLLRGPRRFCFSLVMKENYLLKS